MNLFAYVKNALRVAAFSAVGFVGVEAFAPSDASAAARCTARAFTITGDGIQRTRAVEEAGRIEVACRRARNVCEARLDRVRIRTGFPFPLARCRVTDREELRRRRIRCEAKAFTRNGRLLRNTAAQGTRKNRARACDIALDRCEARLDRLRAATGRPRRHARCQVTDSFRVR